MSIDYIRHMTYSSELKELEKLKSKLERFLLVMVDSLPYENPNKKDKVQKEFNRVFNTNNIRIFLAGEKNDYKGGIKLKSSDERHLRNFYSTIKDIKLDSSSLYTFFSRVYDSCDRTSDDSFSKYDALKILESFNTRGNISQQEIIDSLQSVYSEYLQCVSNIMNLKRPKEEKAEPRFENEPITTYDDPKTKFDARVHYLQSLTIDELIDLAKKEMLENGRISEEILMAIKKRNNLYDDDINSIQAAIKMNLMLEKDSFDVQDIINFAIYCFKSTVTALLCSNEGLGNQWDRSEEARLKSVDSTKFILELNMISGLSNYNKKYREFMNKMNPNMKVELDRALHRNWEYNSLFESNGNPRLINPEEMQNKINMTVSKYIIKLTRSAKYMDNEKYTYENIVKCATSLMSVDEIGQLYGSVVKEMNELNENGSLDQETKDKYAKQMQELFIDLAMSKMQLPIIDYDNLDEINKRRVIDEFNSYRIAISKYILKDKPLFKYLESQDKVSEDELRKRIIFRSEVRKAYERYFGMSKLKKSLAMATGQYRRFMDLVKAKKSIQGFEKITDKEIESVKSMFRR